MKLTRYLVNLLPSYKFLQLSYPLPDKQFGVVSCSRVEKHNRLKYHIEYQIEHREGIYFSKETYTLIHYQNMEPFVDYTVKSTIPNVKSTIPNVKSTIPTPQESQKDPDFRVIAAIPV